MLAASASFDSCWLSCSPKTFMRQPSGRGMASIESRSAANSRDALTPRAGSHWALTTRWRSKRRITPARKSKSKPATAWPSERIAPEGAKSGSAWRLVRL